MTTLKPVKVFTHTDLDGVGSGLIFQGLYGEGNASVTYCDYHNVNDRINSFLENDKPTDYAVIFITDISVDEETAEKLDLIHRGSVARVVLLDHHDTAKWLNKYEWALVEPIHSEAPLHKSSGTSLIIDWFDDEGGYDIPESIRTFAETVRKYDTWEWSTIYNDETPKLWNDLLYIQGRETFVENRLDSFYALNWQGFSLVEETLLNQKQKEIKAYIDKKEKQMMIEDAPYEGGVYKMGVVFAEQNISELGNELCKRNPEIDFVAMVEMGSKKVSFRTVRDDIHLGELAKHLGGGGHPKAAGAQFTEEKIKNFLGELF